MKFSYAVGRVSWYKPLESDGKMLIVFIPTQFSLFSKYSREISAPVLQKTFIGVFIVTLLKTEGRKNRHKEMSIRRRKIEKLRYNA